MTYLSPGGTFRLSRGNKGTLFVLVRDVPPREALVEAVTSSAGAGETRSRQVGGIVIVLQDGEDCLGARRQHWVSLCHGLGS